MTDVNDFLFSGGAKAFQFDRFGAVCKGTIESAELRQQRSLEGELLTWPDGNKRMQLVITLQTKEQSDEEDDGMRTIYAKGGNYEVVQGSGDSMRDAIAQAVKDAGARRMDPGDELAVSYTGLGKAKKGYSAPKLYTAQFRPGKAGVDADDLFGDGNERAGEDF